jgi:hypothetical protein
VLITSDLIRVDVGDRVRVEIGVLVDTTGEATFVAVPVTSLFPVQELRQTWEIRRTPKTNRKTRLSLFVMCTSMKIMEIID